MLNFMVNLLPPDFNKYPLIKKIRWPNTDCVHVWVEKTQEWQVLAETFNGGDLWEEDILGDEN